MSGSGFKGATNVGARQSYERADYGGRGQFGPREAGSVLANAPLVGVPSAIALAAEGAAHTFAPGSLPPGMASVGAWLVNLLVWFVFKVVAVWFRNYASSFLRDLGAYLWGMVADAWSEWRMSRQKKRADRKQDRRKPGGRDPLLPWRRR